MAKQAANTAEVVPLGTPGTVPVVTITNGVPTAGSGTVSTLDNIFDATNGPIAVKAASTPPVAGDKAIVVAMSPNSSGIIGTGTPGAPATAQVLTVQGAPAMTPLLVSQVDPANLVSGIITTAMATTATTAVAGMGAPGAGLRNYITQLTVSNSHATVGTDVELQDGNSGTTFYIVPAAAVYGGAAITFPTPLKQPTANTALYAKNSVTGASVRLSASGYKGA